MVPDELIFGCDFTFAQLRLPSTPVEMFLLFAGTMSSRLILLRNQVTNKCTQP